MNGKILKRYMQMGFVSVFSKISGGVAALAVLYLSNRILGKEGFGEFMLALSVCMLIGVTVSSFFSSLIVYHVSRGNLEKRVTELSLFWGGIAGLLCALILFEGSDLIADWMDKHPIASWLRLLSLMIPAYIMNFNLTSFYRARQSVEIMLMFQEILPAVLKALTLVLIWWFGWPQSWMAHGYTLSLLLPFVGLYFYAPIKPKIDFRGHIDLWDLKYSSMILLSQIVNKSTRNLVTVIIGFYATAAMVAEFVIAMRITQVLLLPKLMLAQLHVPRIGEKLGKKMHAELIEEYDAIRGTSLALTVFACVGLVILGPFVLNLFGPYEAAYPVLLLLCAASVVRAGFGDVGGFISMTGHSVAGLISNLVPILVLIAGFTLWVPLDAFGAGLVFFVSVLVNMGMMAAMLYYYARFNVMSVLSSAVMMVSCAALIALAMERFYA